MADRCEHGARVGQCDEQHPTFHEMIEMLERTLDNTTNFNTKKMDGVDVIFLGHVETDIQRVIEGLRSRT